MADPLQPSRTVCRQKLCYNWRIVDFSRRTDRLVSPTFCSGEDEDVWCLELRLRGNAGDDVGLYLTLVSTNRANIQLNYCKFAVLKSGVKTNKRSFACEYSKGDSRGFNSYTTRKSLLTSTESDVLRILCEIKVSWSDDCQPESSKNCHRDQLIEDLRRSLEDPKFCDAAVTVAGKTFHAHRHILAARSRTLAAMLEEKSREDVKSIEIRDLDPAAVERALRFMYTGDVCGPEAMSAGVLAAADRLQLGGLKAECEEVLLRKIAVGDAVQMLLLGLLHGADRLVTGAFEFIRRNLPDVRETADFQRLRDCVLRWETTEGYVT